MLTGTAREHQRWKNHHYVHICLWSHQNLVLKQVKICYWIIYILQWFKVISIINTYSVSFHSHYITSCSLLETVSFFRWLRLTTNQPFINTYTIRKHSWEIIHEYLKNYENPTWPNTINYKIITKHKSVALIITLKQRCYPKQSSLRLIFFLWALEQAQ